MGKRKRRKRKTASNKHNFSKLKAAMAY